MKVDIAGLWGSASVETQRFDPARMADHPEPVRRYLTRAIAPATPLHRAVRFAVHGRIRLGGTWRAMSGEEVLYPDRGFIWKATVRLGIFPIRGHDACLDGQGGMQWRLFGLVPMVDASGPDVDRSALGRLHLERVWLPTTLVEQPWTVLAEDRIQTQVRSHDHVTELELQIDEHGDLRSVAGRRWRADGPKPHEELFGGEVSSTRSFGGLRLPDRIRLGWGFRTERFETEGVFFDAEIEDVRFPHEAA